MQARRRPGEAGGGRERQHVGAECGHFEEGAGFPEGERSAFRSSEHLGFRQEHHAAWCGRGRRRARMGRAAAAADEPQGPEREPEGQADGGEGLCGCRRPAEVSLARGPRAAARDRGLLRGGCLLRGLLRRGLQARQYHRRDRRCRFGEEPAAHQRVGLVDPLIRGVRRPAVWTCRRKPLRGVVRGQVRQFPVPNTTVRQAVPGGWLDGHV
mmetsp:Transcript_75056/g.244005  ORF Transcript_75056/g.244005 Transcript_75056/m.244005 type:complete len:211 (+) Transcript_75056:222-854(+)